MKVYLVIHDNTNSVYRCFDSEEKARKYINKNRAFRIKEIEVL